MTEVTDEMVKSAAEKLASIDDAFGWLSDDDQHDLMRQVLTTALAEVGPDREGNARLIAAAPDMFAALLRLCDYSKNPTQADWQAADAAIAKAIAPTKEE